jgi:ribosomal protein L25 (general stress protein Ctc)
MSSIRQNNQLPRLVYGLGWLATGAPALFPELWDTACDLLVFDQDSQIPVNGQRSRSHPIPPRQPLPVAWRSPALPGQLVRPRRSDSIEKVVHGDSTETIPMRTEEGITAFTQSPEELCGV